MMIQSPRQRFESHGGGELTGFELPVNRESGAAFAAPASPP